MMFLLANWRWIALALLIAVPMAWGAVMRVQRDFARNELSAFKLDVRAKALEQEAKTNKIIREHQAAKEKADAAHKAATDRLRADVVRLRERADRSLLPASPAATRCPDGQACFDRAELDGALRAFAGEVQGIAIEGSEVRIDLETAKRWAQSVLNSAAVPRQKGE